jgi:predicted amidohydrolase
MEEVPFRVAAVQISSQADVGQNLAECRRRVEEAARGGAKLVLLPENFAYMGPEDGKRVLAESLDEQGGPIASALREMARACGVIVVAGGMPERSADPERPYNTSIAFDARGESIGRYRKIHLFDVDLSDGTTLRESNATARGDEPVVVEAGPLKVGLSVCYDVRFPELYRALVDRGADLLLVPAAFTVHTGKDHWHVLLRARAIESQCYVLAAAQWGKHPGGRTTYGRSLVCDPWGTVVAEAPDRSGVVLADVHPAELTRVRTTLPSLRHRRL